MPYEHGVRVLEQPTSTVSPVRGTSGLQVIFGTAPINLAKDPYAVTNVPIMANTYAEAVEALGYSEDYGKYTLCQSIFASFKLLPVAPVIFVNVLDPATHKKDNDEETVSVVNLSATLEKDGVLPDTVTVKKDEEEETLTSGEDYVLTFDAKGHLVITLTATGKGADAKSLKVKSTSIDPDAVTAEDIVGKLDPATQAESGLEVLRQVYPRFGMAPGLLLAPGWSHDPDVGVVLAAKCEEINGYFRCECFIDVDSTETGAKVYTDVKAKKDAAGNTSVHAGALWPCVVAGSRKFWFSAVMGALMAYTDANNDDVPSLAPGNKLLGITGTVLADAVYTEGRGWDKEVTLDQVQGNALNGWGIITAINLNGWRSWGNNTAAYPAVTDPKDRWLNVRRFFSWWANTFIQTYSEKVDDPANLRLVEAIVDSENIRGQAYVPDKCAAISIEFNQEENDVGSLLNGQLKFHQHLSPYIPAEDIVDTLEFDPDALRAALNGGGE